MKISSAIAFVVVHWNHRAFFYNLLLVINTTKKDRNKLLSQTRADENGMSGKKNLPFRNASIQSSLWYMAVVPNKTSCGLEQVAKFASGYSAISVLPMTRF